MTRALRVRPLCFSSFLTTGLLSALLVGTATTGGAQTTSAPPVAETMADSVLRDWSDEVPAHIALVDGSAWLERDDIAEAAAEGTPLLTGDRIRTASGRLEVLFADGSVLTFDEYTDAELLSDTLLRLDGGRIRLDLARAAGADGYRIDAVGTTTWIRTAGEYRLDVDARSAATPNIQLLVIRGLAELMSEHGRTLVRAGYEASASATTRPSLPYAVTVSRWDAFDRWWEARRNERDGFFEAPRLPSEIAYYSGVLARDGQWQYEPVHGYVWYPHVDAGWHPYSTGRWTFVGIYGWTWIGTHRWAWPTHHYGRWGLAGNRYYWIPGRHWSPAWVSWASTHDYIGWSPLGFDNRPLVSVSLGYTQGWRGWTYLPSSSFHVRVVISSPRRYVPPRSQRVISGFRGPVRPVSVTNRTRTALRGPGVAGRSSVAIPRTSVGGVRAAGPAVSTRPARGAVQSRSSEPVRSIPGTPAPRTAPGVARTTPSRVPSSRTQRADAPDAPRSPELRSPAKRAPLSTGGARPRVSVTSPPTRSTAPAARMSPSRALPSRSTTPAAPSPSPDPVVERRQPVPARSGAIRSRSAAVPQDRGRPAAPSATQEGRSRGVAAPGPTRPVRTMPSAPAARPAAPAVRERQAPSAPSRAPRVESARTPDRQALAASNARSSRSSAGRAQPRGR